MQRLRKSRKGPKGLGLPGRVLACIAAMVYLVGPFHARVCQGGCAGETLPASCCAPAPAEEASCRCCEASAEDQAPLHDVALHTPECCVDVDFLPGEAPVPPGLKVKPPLPLALPSYEFTLATATTFAPLLQARANAPPPDSSPPLYLSGEALLR